MCVRLPMISLVGLVVFAFIAIEPSHGAERIRNFGQLPTSLQPIHYRLSVQPFFPADGVTYDANLNFTFRGNLSILLECLDETDNITMNMDRIEIINNTVTLIDVEESDGRPTPLSRYIYEEKSQEVSFAFDHVLKPGKKYELNISYIGSLAGEDLAGFYISSYIEDGQKKWMAVTQFEPTDARRALPCFDEPFYKAVFYVTIIHPTSMIALSNGMENPSIKLEDGWSVTSFLPTPNMSTYLLALAVCDFRSKSNYTTDGKTLFRIWARPSFINKTDYAVAAGPKVLDYYAEYFNIPFPLPKQDMLAIPDFAAGAMENWGLITYRETALLYDDRLSSSMNRQRVALVVAHELSHQWFGDLVTMQWWDDLWLNEGFATYMEFVGTDVISDGSFRMDSQFVATAVQSALALDQLDTSHPIFVPVSSVDEIFEVFDDISYEKGGSAIRMLNYTLSNEVLRKGLQIYLTKSSYANANHNNLWEALTEAAQNATVRDWNGDRLNVTEFMNPWVLQMGFPVLDVSRKYGETSKSATVTQRRFVLEESGDGKSLANPAFLSPPFNFTWHVPLWYHTETTAVQSGWLEANQTLTIYMENDDEWLLLNYDAAAYCRVNYDERNWRLLQGQLNSDFRQINEKSRAQLVDDSLQLARAGYLSYNVALDTTKYLVNETAMVPWQSAIASLDHLGDMLALYPGFKHYKNYILALTRNLYDRYGFTDSLEPIDDVASHYLRQLAVSKQCRLNSSDCIQTALSLFQLFASACQQEDATSSACSNVSPSLRGTIYCIGAQEDDENAGNWHLLWNLHAREQMALEKERLVFGLCCTKNDTLMNKLLNEAINPNSTVIRRQDAQFVFRNLAENDDARLLLWPFIEENWNQIRKWYAKVGLKRMIVSATRSFNTEEQVTQMQQFYDSHSSELGPVKRTYQQQLERARANKHWMESYGKIVLDWLKIAGSSGE